MIGAKPGRSCKTSYQKSRGYLKKQIWKKSSKKAGDQGRLKEELS